ncbi:MAG: DNA-binding protein, Tfx family [uncultured archaeon A07HR67]|jgi:DNA-binding protein, Tfx family|nr:MAG: DNA-binding protein, Tfx family [uncultured archaeon A07HR67]
MTNGDSSSDYPDPEEIDVTAVLEERGFDPDESVLTQRQAEVYVLREREYRQRDVADILGTSRANVASVEASARENVRKARNTVGFADVLASPIHVEVEPDADLYDVPGRVFATCDDAGVNVNYTAPELMEHVSEAAGDGVRGRQIVRRIVIGVTSEGEISVTSR